MGGYDVVKYVSKDGQALQIGLEDVRRYLVQGNRDKVTEQELVFFLQVCKSRGLNPFKKDAYLIKYGEDPAAIVTSVDYFRSRARAQKDCKGWRKGIVVQTKDGTLRDSAGILLDGEKLVGGFFEAKPEGWSEPFRLEVNLKGYIKKTREGKITRFWQEDNQPSQIAKVAESQGLRALWPDEFQGLYEEAEIQEGERTIDMSQAPDGVYGAEKKRLSYEETIPAGTDTALLAQFLKAVAVQHGTTIDAIKADVVSSQEKTQLFWSAFEKWQGAKKKVVEAAAAETQKTEPAPESADTQQDETDETEGGKYRLWPVVKRLRAKYASEIWRLFKSGAIKNATEADLASMKAKWADEVKGAPWPSDAPAEKATPGNGKGSKFLHCPERNMQIAFPVCEGLYCDKREQCSSLAEYIDSQRF
jgi:phage recombination protein Bet